ncbi:MAG: hypothetical protein EOP13_14195 [Pseudomonas sp.]|uniref:hypothetical protein n=1 Tax=Pseudomonas sp. TaxID=306 RepID=UPI0011FCF088|nr:hypothetical protein [Pseudomonas sp.]RZI72730.1 MAG: hypothetical protein EOP13_14195 [Pseudomonas sp.]
MTTQNAKPAAPFEPYANESDVLRIGHLEIENRVDRVSLTGDAVLTRDRAGLALAKDLQALLASVIETLEADKTLPEVVEVLAAKTVKNPFA